MGEYTVTFDASHKVKASGGHKAHWVHHIARDVDRENGCEANHSNERIVPERTPMNYTLVNKDGELVPCTDTREIIEAIDKRLSDVTGLVRANSVALRPLVLEIDTWWFEENNPDWRENGLNEAGKKVRDDMLEFAMTRFNGEKNIPAASFHLDEDKPGWQIAFTPVTEDGRLSQRDTFVGPITMRKFHDDFRQFMIDKGYDIDTERTERSREHLSSAGIVAERERLARRHKSLDKQMESINAEYLEKKTEIDLEKLKLEDLRKLVDEERQAVKDARAELDRELPELKANAVKEGQREGFKAGVDSVAKSKETADANNAAAAAALARARKMEDDAKEDAAKVALERAQVAAEWQKLKEAVTELEQASTPSDGFDLAVRGIESVQPLSSGQKTGLARAKTTLPGLTKKRRDTFASVHARIHEHELASPTPSTWSKNDPTPKD